MDVIHYRYFGDFTSLTEFGQFGQIGNIRESIISLFQYRDLLLFIDLLLWIPLAVYFFISVPFENNQRSMIAGLAALYFPWFCASQPLNVFFQYGGKDILNKMISSETVYKYVGIIGYHY